MVMYEKLKVDNTIAYKSIIFPVVLCGKQRDIKRLQTAEVQFVSFTAEYNLLNQTRNGDMLEEFKVDPIKKKFAQYKKIWSNHVSRIEDIKYPKQIY